MSATAKRKITLTFFGDLDAEEVIDAADNNASPAQTQVLTLAIGDNTITAPGGGTTPKACTIVKPDDNETAIKLKGDAGDTGVRLHDTDPDTVSLDASQSTFILHAAAQIIGVRLFWT